MATANAELEIDIPTSKETIQEFLDMLPDDAKFYIRPSPQGSGRAINFLHAYWNPTKS
jgi:hypothetical protein